MYTLVCEDSVSGVLSGIYEVWAGRYNRNKIKLKAGDIENYELFMEYRYVGNDMLLAVKVADTIKQRFGEETYEMICYALWSSEEDKADAVYQMVRYGIENRCGAELRNHLTQPFVRRVFQLFRRVHNEAHHYLGFLRFAELENGVLYGEVRPKNQILEPLALHFADRLPGEHWLIHDSIRQKVAVHRALDEWLVVDEVLVSDMIQKPWKQSEAEFRQMWKSFCESVSIEARKNTKLQQQNLPLRFRQTMIE